jgi:hypothetical protein
VREEFVGGEAKTTGDGIVKRIVEGVLVFDNGTFEIFGEGRSDVRISSVGGWFHHDWRRDERVDGRRRRWIEGGRACVFINGFLFL